MGKLEKQQQRQQRVVGEVGYVCFFFGAQNNGLGCKFANTFKMGRKVYMYRYMSVEENVLIKFGKLGFLKHRFFFF